MNEKSFELLKKYIPFALCALQSEDYVTPKEKYKMGILLLRKGKFSNAMVMNIRSAFKEYSCERHGFFRGYLIGNYVSQYLKQSGLSLDAKDLKLFVAEMSCSSTRVLLGKGCCGVVDADFSEHDTLHGVQADLVNLLWDFSYLYSIDLVPCCTTEISTGDTHLFWDKFYNDFVIYARTADGLNFVCKALKPKSVSGIVFEKQMPGAYVLSVSKPVAILKPSKQRHDICSLGFNFMIDFNYNSCGITETFIRSSKFVTKTLMWVPSILSWNIQNRSVEDICGYKFV